VKRAVLAEQLSCCDGFDEKRCLVKCTEQILVRNRERERESCEEKRLSDAR
jgi:hypothetical protein